MSTTREIIEEFLSDLDDGDVYTVLAAMEQRFLITSCVWTPRDVELTDDEGEPDYDGLTTAEAAAVADTYEWRRGMPEAAQGHVADAGIVPSVVRHGDGSFTVRTCDEELEYGRDGNELPTKEDA